jgi:hypothetical protein
MTSTLSGRRQRIRNFISTVLEAHQEPDSVKPTLGELAACLTDEVPAELSRDEELIVEPEPYRPHPAGHLRRHDGQRSWAQVPGTGCYVCFPTEFDMRYKFEVVGGFAAMVLQKLATRQDLILSENYTEVPVERLVIDPQVVVILLDRRHDDIELIVS